MKIVRLIKFSLVLFFEVAEALVHFDLVLAPLLPCFILLVVKTDKVLACHVESVQMLDCLFRAKNVFVHYKASAFGLW